MNDKNNFAATEYISVGGLKQIVLRHPAATVAGVFILFCSIALALIVLLGTIRFPFAYISPVLPSLFLMGWLYLKLIKFAVKTTGHKEFYIILIAFWLTLMMLCCVFLIYIGCFN